MCQARLFAVAFIFIAGLTSLCELAERVNNGTLLAFVVVAVGVIVLRAPGPAFRAPCAPPLVPFVPIASASV